MRVGEEHVRSWTQSISDCTHSHVGDNGRLAGIRAAQIRMNS